MVTYRRRGDAITANEMNELVSAFAAKLGAILGNRSFILAFPRIPNGAGQIPPRLMGKTFFFTSGVTAYAHTVPGAVTMNVATVDPVTGLAATGTGVRAYDHSYFAAAALAASVSYDTTNQVRYIADVAQGAYPPGVQKQNGISLFEHSLAAHTQFEQPAGDATGHLYFLGELQSGTNGGGVFPTKLHQHALFEFIIEGVPQVNIPHTWDAGQCFRIHNLQPVPAIVAFESDGFNPGYSVQLGPWECKSIRRTVAIVNNTVRLTNYRAGYRYFQAFESGEGPVFWYWNSTPSFVNPTVLAADTAVVTKEGAAQANNLVNPCVLYDFMFSFRENGDCYARFQRDVHELCDMGPDFVDKFACFNANGTLKNDAIIGDLFHHKGTVHLNRLQRTPASSASLVQTAFEFRGYKTLIADLAQLGITAVPDVSGNLVLQKVDANFFFDLLPFGTNFLKRSGDVDADWQKLPVALNLNNGRTLEARVFEHTGAAGQDALGYTAFNLRETPSYRVFQRGLNTFARSRQYRDASGALRTVNGQPDLTLSLLGGGGRTINGIHSAPVSELLSLSYFGDPALAVQDDAHVQYLNARLTLTPEGWVLTFTESVRGDLRPWFQGLFDARLDVPTGYVVNTILSANVFRLNATSGRFEFRHAIRFRKHGWGWSQAGKDNAAHYSCVVGRCTNGAGWVNIIKGPAGADASMAQNGVETTARALRQVRVTELSAAGARFYIDNVPCDGWGAYAAAPAQYGHTPSTGLQFYDWRAAFLAGNAPTGQGVTTYLPMLAEHFNAMAQAVNQLKTGTPLDVKALRIAYGHIVLSFDWTGRVPTALAFWTTAFGGLPAPANAFIALVSFNSGSPLFLELKPYFEKFFGDRGISFTRTVADYPHLAEFQTITNQQRDIVQDVTVSLTNLHVGDSFRAYHPDLNTSWLYTTLDGTLSWTITAPAWTAPRDSVGGNFAVIDGAVTFPTPQRNNAIVDLRTNYNGLKWLSEETFKDFCDDVGFTVSNIEVFVPLKLDTFELSNTFEDSQFFPSALNGSYTGRIWCGENSSIGASSPNPIDPQILTWISSTFPRTNHTTLAGGIITRQLAFRLAETAAESEWKLAIPNASLVSGSGLTQTFDRGPLFCWNHLDRTPGRYALSKGGHVWFRTAAYDYNNIRNVADAAAALIFAINGATTPGLPALHLDYPVAGTVDGTPGQGEFVCFTEHRDAGSPRAFADLTLPQDATAAQKQDRYAAWQNGERRWYACRIVATEGIALEQPFYLVPVADWGLELDWWRANQAYYLRGMGYTGFADPPPRDTSAVAASAVVTAANGVTLLKPTSEAARILYDVREFRLTLP